MSDCYSPRAVAVNIEIMRAFMRILAVISADKEIAHKLEQLKGKMEEHRAHADEE